MDFLETEKSCKTAVEFPSEDSNMKSSVEDGVAEDVMPLKSYDTSVGNSKLGDAVSDLFQHIKHAVENAVEGMKHAVENVVEGTSTLWKRWSAKSPASSGIFGQKADGKTDGAAGKEDGGSSFVETVVGHSFMGLTVLAIFVVILRRP